MRDLDEIGCFVKSYYDLYRIQDGKIAEHWDTLGSSAARRLEERERQILKNRRDEKMGAKLRKPGLKELGERK
jgi:hypothetical protein